MSVLVKFHNQLDRTYSRLGRGDFNRRIASIRLACGHVCEKGSRLMIADGCEKAQPSVDHTIPRQVDLG